MAQTLGEIVFANGYKAAANKINRNRCPYVTYWAKELWLSGYDKYIKEQA